MKTTGRPIFPHQLVTEPAGNHNDFLISNGQFNDDDDDNSDKDEDGHNQEENDN
jgi:hypothetical protein